MLRGLRVKVLGTAVVLLFSSLAARAEAPLLGVEISLEPGEQAGTYQVLVIVQDASSGEVLSAPRLTFRAGEPAAASSRTPSGELVELEVAVSNDGSEATFVVRLPRDGKPLTLQKGRIRLEGRPADRPAPDAGAPDASGS